MVIENAYLKEVLETLADLLDIPDSHYQLARDRYESLGNWLHRKESEVLNYQPSVYPQGSFRLGTVVRPLLNSEEYDLDLVCQLNLSKEEISQKNLKELVGGEIKKYAAAHPFQKQAEEKRRCWRLDYADNVKFHIDILPTIPDDQEFMNRLVVSQVPKEFAELAVAITDRTDPSYEVIDLKWPRSNPKGFAQWFASKVKLLTTAQAKALVEKRLYASIDDVPTFKWKSPLQETIQILKRHRDVMFKDNPDGKPISIIITTLSAQAYQGEKDLASAMTKIIDEIPQLVNGQPPYVHNPINPFEDFADKWQEDFQLRENFWLWHAQVKADLKNLATSFDKSQLQYQFSKFFGIVLLDESATELTKKRPDYAAQPPAVVNIKAGQHPWSMDV